ncbi:Hypothetical predicted protein [Podarcis lilfordi]|uniref:Uncharacterized protein n=1 Tax=Podarcis lilfordi TaxID=74358 RepID=A0AA35K318_9SAUR|nr:Hypothetical predicted protein [Podarcis lilfordi]
MPVPRGSISPASVRLLCPAPHELRWGAPLRRPPFEAPLPASIPPSPTNARSASNRQCRRAEKLAPLAARRGSALEQQRAPPPRREREARRPSARSPDHPRCAASPQPRELRETGPCERGERIAAFSCLSPPQACITDTWGYEVSPRWPRRYDLQNNYDRSSIHGFQRYPVRRFQK